MMLHGPGCCVREWRLGDAESLARHANNLNIARHLRDRFPHPYTLSDANAFLVHAARERNHDANLAIDIDGEAVGGIGLHIGDDLERFSAEVGYWLSEAYWGRGVATEALKMVSAHVFERRNLLRLFALPFADNAASARVLEKAGFVREGVLRASAVKYGRPRDQLLYARINDRWQAASWDNPIP
jgi:ribosomal-protein-alanine N-acetyltransferase